MNINVPSLTEYMHHIRQAIIKQFTLQTPVLLYLLLFIQTVYGQQENRFTFHTFTEISLQQVSANQLSSLKKDLTPTYKPLSFSVSQYFGIRDLQKEKWQFFIRFSQRSAQVLYKPKDARSSEDKMEGNFGIQWLDEGFVRSFWMGRHFRFKCEAGFFAGQRINAWGQSVVVATSVHGMSFDTTTKTEQTANYLSKNHAGILLRGLFRQGLFKKTSLYAGGHFQIESLDFQYGPFWIKHVGLDLRLGF